MTELKPLADLPKDEKKPVEKPIEKHQNQPEKTKEPEKVELSQSLLQKVNGELCFNLQLKNGSVLVSLSRCESLATNFSKMDAEQKEKFLMQAAIFGANPFSTPPEIYAVPFPVDGKTIYAPVISYKKYIEVASQFKGYDGYRSGVTVETETGQIIDRRGQVFGSKETLIGGWCEVFIKGIREPIFRGVNLKEFEKRKTDGTLTKFWKDSPANQIEKVAIKNAHEIACNMPKIYIEEEIPTLDIDHEDVTGQKAIGNDDFFNDKEQ